jgi:hypothetical protein
VVCCMVSEIEPDQTEWNHEWVGHRAKYEHRQCVTTNITSLDDDDIVWTSGLIPVKLDVSALQST